MPTSFPQDDNNNDHTSLLSLQKGKYHPPEPSSLRSACPVVNTLANHGLIPRDGRSVRASELSAAIYSLGISSTISRTLTYATFLEHQPRPDTGFWAFVKAPFAYVLRKFGMRDPNQKDAEGYKCIDLNQLNRPGVVEHDVSMTRRDAAQGDNHSRQDDLVRDLIASSSDGIIITTGDLAQFRRRRLEQARKENPHVLFGDDENSKACAEVALVQRVFGHQKKDWAIPVAYVRALFGQERLPEEEGWKRRSRWWRLGIIESILQVRVVTKAVGPLQ